MLNSIGCLGSTIFGQVQNVNLPKAGLNMNPPSTGKALPRFSVFAFVCLRTRWRRRRACPARVHTCPQLGGVRCPLFMCWNNNVEFTFLVHDVCTQQTALNGACRIAICAVVSLQLSRQLTVDNWRLFGVVPEDVANVGPCSAMKMGAWSSLALRELSHADFLAE